MQKIFEKNNFEVLKVFPVQNIVTFSRLLELMPINEKLKNLMTRIQNGLCIGKFSNTIVHGKLGNICKKK